MPVCYPGYVCGLYVMLNVNDSVNVKKKIIIIKFIIIMIVITKLPV
jgi:hypothetical protein